MRRTFLLFFVLISVATETTYSQTSSAKEKQAGDETEQQEYIRIRRSDRRAAVALETSVIHFGQSKMYPNATVDLIGAIHLGEADYYKQLNRLFAEYDILLFEAVMPEKAVRMGLRPGGGRSGRSHRINPEQEWTEAKVGLQAIGILQLGMKDVLGLEFQLAGVDYTARNFVHADMTQEEFERSMAARGESFSEILAREMGKAALMQQQVNPVAQQLDVLISLLASDRVYRVRRIAAVELTKANEGDAFAGADGTSTIITERNIKALSVLKNQLRRGQRRIGVFYGAGHFPDMEERLVDEFRFERLSEKWLTAWHLKAPAEKKK